MTSRPAVLIRAEDSDGITGWGEVWCNFPSTGAEHRTRIVNEILSPMLLATSDVAPASTFSYLTRSTSVLALQSGEPGPFAQSIAGIDLALWDIAARKARMPLWRMLGGESASIRVYASGINPSGAQPQAEAALRRGHRALKLKIGFEQSTDEQNLAALRTLVGPEGFLAADANQAWTIEEATARARSIDSFGLNWLEEPMRADRPWQEWQRLSRSMKTPLAAGENITSIDTFQQALTDDTLGFIQPDVAKWGGLTLCSGIARDVRAAGKTFCPHYLGAGIGLLASAHLLAAVGGDGFLEIDSNDNPLRDELCGAVADVRDGTVTLGDEPGLGFAPDLSSLERWRAA